MFKVSTRKTSPGRLCFARQGRRRTQAAKRPCANENFRFHYRFELWRYLGGSSDNTRSIEGNAMLPRKAPGFSYRKLTVALPIAGFWE